MISNIQILSDLRLAMEMRQELELMVTFKGVPVICKAKVTQIEGETVTLVTRDPGLIRIEHENKISVLGSEFFEPSTAKVIKVDIHSGTLELNNFSYLGTRLGERMMMRVEPKEPIRVSLESESLLFDGEIVDMSLNGIGIRIDQPNYNPSLKPGTTIKTSFDLPNSRIEMEGTVLSSVKAGNIYRLSLRFNQNGPQKIAIFRYLIDRRAEIENELKSDFERARNKTT
jgi:PilZ domain